MHDPVTQQLFCYQHSTLALGLDSSLHHHTVSWQDYAFISADKRWAQDARVANQALSL